ncbi:P-loop NTPase [Fibrobacterota bacterium]
MKNPVIISFGGGKGGVGKSTMASNIGALLAQNKRSVGFIDADLGGANLHLCLGVKRPRYNLQDYLSGRVNNLSDITEKTIVENSWLISGASDILELANPFFNQKQKIINNIKKLEVEYILVDLGAGSSSNVTDFFAAFSNGIIILDGLPTSIENAYGFIKNGIIRGITRLFPGRKDLKSYFQKFSDPQSEGGFATVREMLDFLNHEYPEETRTIREWLSNRKTFLILNMVKYKEDISVANKFTEIVKKYLNVSLQFLGYLINEPEMRRSMREMKPLVMSNPPQKALECFSAITENLMTLTNGRSSTV